MRFYTQRHQYYVGVDLHARSMYVCILDNAGKVLEHRKLPTERQAFLDLLRPYRKDPVVAVECLSCRYWPADLCVEQGIAFVLGHALFMKAIHGGKSKNDRIDSYKIAALLRETSFQRFERKHGRGKALSVLAAKLGQATYHMLRRRQPFDARRPCRARTKPIRMKRHSAASLGKGGRNWRPRRERVPIDNRAPHKGETIAV